MSQNQPTEETMAPAALNVIGDWVEQVQGHF
jgi:hypothetical protein